MTHPALTRGRVAVITGAASGIGLAASERFAALGMRVAMADVAADALPAAAERVADAAPGGAADVLYVATDVGDAASVAALKAAVDDRFGDAALLMNNAVVRDSARTWDGAAAWDRAMTVNLWGVIHAVQAFVPSMIAAAAPALVVNAGSKQGITNPPRNTPYNVTKAALKAYTELLQHELRNVEDCQVTAHLLVPGMVATGGRPMRPGAWLPEQVIAVMMAALARGDFYILCPDGEVTPDMDRKRILWAAGDLIDNRPALSRWHPDWADAFEHFTP